MKKILLFTLAIGIAVSVSAQATKHVAHFNGNTVKYTPVSKLVEPTNPAPVVKSLQTNQNALKTNNVITDIPIGTAGNSFGFYGNGRTYLWADDNIGAVTFLHRAGAAPGSGFLQVDLSVDNGATWGINLGPVYSPDGTTTFNARYPQGAIYNPSGNTDPDNAYFTYWAPTLEGSNMSWGGMAYGAYKLDTITAPVQACFSTTGGYRYVIPTAFHVCQTGEAWAGDWNDSLDATGYAYTINNEYQLAKGIWNSGTGQYDYTRSLIQIPMTGGANGQPLQKFVADCKIAFAPDGQTGYIAFIGHNDYTFMPDSVYYPILYKTINGGTTWTGPINVDLTNMMTLHDAFWPGNDTMFLISSAFELDLAVDADGNPYLAVDACVAVGSWSVPSSTVIGGVPYHVMSCVYSADGGTNWDAIIIDGLQTFRGTFTDGTNTISSDNRPQIATNMDGTAMFITWIDTDTLTFGSADGNYYPDLHCRGFNVSDLIVTPALTSSSNVTTGSSADGTAYMGSASYYVFDLGNNVYEVPMAYQAMDPVAPLNPVIYHYIKDATINLSVGIQETNSTIASVSQNYPNPVNGTSVVTVNLSRSADLSMSISNLLGQKVYETSKGSVNAGTYYFNIDGSNLSAGVYTYTVKAGDYSVTHKMVVE